MKKKYIHIVLITLLLTPASLLFCYTYILNIFQDKPGDDYNFRIEFVRSISNTNDIIKDKSFGEEIIDWIFGEDIERLVRPMGIINDEKDRIFVLDQGMGDIVLIDTLDQELNLLLNEAEEYFPSLVGICKWNENIFLFTDSRRNQIYFFNLLDNSIEMLNKELTLNQPTGIAYNTLANEIWVVETLNHQISILDSKGKRIRIVGTRGTEKGQFNFPTYIWIDKDGIVYVVDSMNFRIQILNKDGEVLNIFGEAGDATGYFARPKGVATDSFGHVYIVDALYNTIQVFDKEGHFLYYFGTKGSTKGEFWLPTGIFIDSEDYIYVADSYNSRIQIFKLLSNEQN
ncbi:MAG: 6-bladed beta-propeller [Ignavibacteriae bacterium]|nr:MAG: 6-bladed beta-propeller [Ignavibacteriota bacterium]